GRDGYDAAGDPGAGGAAGALVPQHGAWRGTHRAPPLPGRLPGDEVPQLRPRHPGGPEREVGAGRGVQRRLLLHGDEAPRRRAGGGDRQRRPVPGAGPLRHLGQRHGRHRVPQDVRVRRGGAGGEVRLRDLHGRSLPPAAPPARPGPAARARGGRPDALPEHAARVHGGGAGGRRLRFPGRGALRPPGLPQDALHRAPLRARPHQLVGAQPGVRRGHAAQLRLRDPAAGGGRGVPVQASGDHRWGAEGGVPSNCL
ncbi:MAG: tRNA (mo5U34)-methyltransferase, partial [uncultured Gemmatimonadetes bacterium]